MGSPSFSDWLNNTKLTTDDEVQSPVNLVPNPQPFQHWENFFSEEPLINNCLLSDPLYAPLNTELSPDVIETEIGSWDELGVLLKPQSENPLSLNEQDYHYLSDQNVLPPEYEVGFSSRRSKRGSYRTTKIIAERLSLEVVSSYFYLPIKQAAKELGLGERLLSDRCRELGIQHWPGRKLRSMHNLINDFKALPDAVGLEGAIVSLEEERKNLEKYPDMKLSNNTQSLRKRWFKVKDRLKRLKS